MPKQFFLHSCRAVALGLLTLIAFVVPSFAQKKILGAYFEEWSIYYAGYNIANFQQNGVANKLSHLMYAFANVTTTPAAGMRHCRLVGGLSDALLAERERATVYGANVWKLRGDPTVEGTASVLESTDVDWRSVVVEYAGFPDCIEHGSGASSVGDLLHRHVY